MVDDHGHERESQRIHDAGLFEGRLGQPMVATLPRARALSANGRSRSRILIASRRSLSELDLYLLGEGTHMHLYEKLGAPSDGTAMAYPGVAFAVFAPAARRVSVVGDFNLWDGRRHAMRVRGNGFGKSSCLKPRSAPNTNTRLSDPTAVLLPLKSDPLAFAAEVRPQTASIVVDPNAVERPRPAPARVNALSAPISIYEVHLGSWRRRSQEGNRWLTYRELAEATAGLRARPGIHAYRVSAGQRAPLRRFLGLSADRPVRPNQPLRHPGRFAALIDACHRAGLAVILDWVPGHFPDDPHGLSRFDGTALYEHDNPDARPPPGLEYSASTITGGPRSQTSCWQADCSGWIATASTGCACDAGRLHALSRLQPA